MIVETLFPKKWEEDESYFTSIECI
jgi:hypothetical protein